MADSNAGLMHTGFLRWSNFLFLRIAALLALVCIALYVLFQPVSGPSGNTWVGYGLGTFGAVLILWLCWLGVRKRSYRSKLGSVSAWVSAHVYLGVLLALVATLHTGFQFAWNIHTLAYVLMMIVIGSGLLGIFCYSNYPSQISQLRDGQTREDMIDEIMDLNEKAVGLADDVDPQFHDSILQAVHSMSLGGGLWRQLKGHGRARSSEIDFIEARLGQSDDEGQEDIDMESTAAFMASSVLQQDKISEGERLRQLIDVVGRRNVLLDRVNAMITRQARMRAWLFLVHIPVSVGLLAALLAHVVSVFLYW